MFNSVRQALCERIAKIEPAPVQLIRFDILTPPKLFSAKNNLQIDSKVFLYREVIFDEAVSSKNLLYAIGLAEPVSWSLLTEPSKTFDYLEQLLSWPEVSKNLFVPLPIPKCDGKNYTHRRTEVAFQQPLFDDDELQSKRIRTSHKAYKETKTPTGTTRQLLTIWDMILPILQPALDLDFTEQLLLPGELYNFQKSGVSFLLNNAGALLGDEMGTGKTVITAVAMRVLFQQGQIQKALVVCPKTALSVWTEHLSNWTNLKFTEVTGPAGRREIDWRCPAHVYLITYDTLRSDVLNESCVLTEDMMAQFDLVILDEAHHIRNPDSGKAQVVKLFRPKYRWALTGTPIQNRLDDLVSIFDFVKPNYLRSEGLTPSRAKRLIEPYFRRVEKKDVMPELPPKVREERWLELDDDQLAEYKVAENREFDNLRQMTKTKITQFHIFTMIQRLKETCNFAQGKTTSPKLELTMDLVEEIAEDEKKVLIFSQYKKEGVEKLVEPLAKFGVVKITGESNNSERQSAISKLRNDPDTHVFLATVKAAGESITLTEASYVIHFDHWWNPAVMWQAEDRAHRKGQEETVNIYSLWMTGTIDEKIHDILERKGLLHEEVISGLAVEDINKFISTEEWLQVLGIKTKDEAVAGVGEKPPVKRELSVGEVLARLEVCDPLQFEQIIKELFRKLGYANAKTTKASHDGGVDIIASRRAVGGPERIVVQCKRRTTTVGEEVARELLGVVTADRNISKGFLVVSGNISPKCRAFCEKDGHLACLSGIEVANYLIQFGISV